VGVGTFGALLRISSSIRFGARHGLFLSLPVLVAVVCRHNQSFAHQRDQNRQGRHFKLLKFAACLASLEENAAPAQAEPPAAAAVIEGRMKRKPDIRFARQQLVERAVPLLVLASGTTHLIKVAVETAASGTA
jgi:hypothetical protein